MRTLSLILALAFVLCDSSMAGTAAGSLPGIGTFSYNGPPIGATPPPVAIATR
jgi:hypothetical protein